MLKPKPGTVKAGFNTGSKVMSSTNGTPVPKPPQRMRPRSRARDWGGELAKEYWEHGFKKF